MIIYIQNSNVIIKLTKRVYDYLQGNKTYNDTWVYYSIMHIKTNELESNYLINAYFF